MTDNIAKILKEFTLEDIEKLKLLSQIFGEKQIQKPIQNVTIEAVRKTRYRVRKKLNLESDDSLEQFLIKFH